MFQIRKWLVISAVIASMPSLALADVLRHETRYRVSLAGLPIARADFKTEVTGKQFTIRGDITSAGLADLVTSIDAKTDVTGVVNENKLQATHYSLFYKSGKRERTYDVAYTNGNVTANTITPEPKRPDTWVPLGVSDLKSVLDPISGMIFPITPSLNLCNQTLAVFDGEMRMDLKLSPKGSHPFSTEGFKGKTIACGVRFTPKGGYKGTRKDYLYLAKSDGMEIWFAKADAMNVYAPVYVRIPTQYGTVTITAVKYGS